MQALHPHVLYGNSLIKVFLFHQNDIKKFVSFKHKF